MKAASDGPMKGMLSYTEDKVVATDFSGEPRTSVFDADAGIVSTARSSRSSRWYDNEWGFSCKVLEMVARDREVATARSRGELQATLRRRRRGKRVFIRADLNVPQDDAGNITDDTRIRASVPGDQRRARRAARR